MAVPSPDAFASLLSTLDSDAFTSFVTDLWRVRGWTVARDGDVLIATASGETRRLVPVVTRRFRGFEPRLDGLDGVDIIVDRDGAATDAVTDGSTQCIGPTDLRSMVLYGVDRSDAEDLFREYFNRSIDDSDPVRSPVVITAESAEEDDDTGGRSGIDSAVPIERASALVLVLLVVAAGATALGVDLLGSNGMSGRDGAVDYNGSHLNGSGNFSVGAGSGSGISWAYPPGVSEDHVNGSSLAEAHADAVGNQSFGVRFSTREERRGNGTESAYQHRSESGYRASRTTFVGWLSSTRSDSGNVSHVLVEQYANESDRYLRIVDRNGNRTLYERRPRDPHDSPLTWTKTNLEEYLGQSNATVTRVSGSRGRYRVVVTDVPKRAHLPPNTTRYRAVAVVNSSGFVSRFDLEYTIVDESSEGTTTHWTHQSYRITDVGNVTVSQPSWYDNARRQLGNDSERASTVVGNRTTG